MKKLIHIVISSTIVIASLITYIYVVSPKTVGVVDEYSNLTTLDETTQHFEMGDIIYIYTTDKYIYEIDAISSNQTILRQSPSTSYLLTINSEYEDATDSIIKSASVREYFDSEIPEIEGHRIIAEIEFKGDNYTFDTPSSTRFIYSTELATPTTITYDEYLFAPLISGVFGFSYLFLVLVSMSNRNSTDVYDQGYKKPQRRKKERY